MSEAKNRTIRTIAISGLDGSGKSTQIKLLKEYLESQGAKVFYFHGISFSLPNKLLDFLRGNGEENEKDSQNSVTRSGWLGIQLRKMILPIDLLRFKLLLNKLKKDGYAYLLSDRYFYDTVVNIEYLESQIANRKSQEYNPKNNIPRPDISIYIQTDPDLIMTRNKKVPDQGLEFLKKKKEILDKKTEVWGWIVLNNTHKNKFETFEEIKGIIKKIRLANQ